MGDAKTEIEIGSKVRCGKVLLNVYGDITQAVIGKKKFDFRPKGIIVQSRPWTSSEGQSGIDAVVQLSKPAFIKQDGIIRQVSQISESRGNLRVLE